MSVSGETLESVRSSFLPTEEDFDDMHHALGHPKTCGVDTYRNHYCCEIGGDKARRFEESGWWDFGRNSGGLAIYHVNGVGQHELAKWLLARPNDDRTDSRALDEPNGAM